MLEKTLESPLNSKEIKPVNLPGNQSWIFIGRTDAEAEAPILWPPDAKNWLIEKHPDAGKGWRQKEKGTTEDEMVGWHHQLDGHEFEHAPGIGDGQGNLPCCSPWGRKESDTTKRLNWTEKLSGSCKGIQVWNWGTLGQNMTTNDPWVKYHFTNVKFLLQMRTEDLGKLRTDNSYLPLTLDYNKRNDH